jgi:hypothetical protein
MYNIISPLYNSCIVFTCKRTFSIVVLDTETNFPAVRVNSLLAMAMINTRERWIEADVPTQSQFQAASLTLSA